MSRFGEPKEFGQVSPSVLLAMDSYRKLIDREEHLRREAMADRDEWRALARELGAAANAYANAGLRLQRAINLSIPFLLALDGPTLEQLGVMMDWETACIKHGDLTLVLAKLREKEERDAGTS